MVHTHTHTHSQYADLMYLLFIRKKFKLKKNEEIGRGPVTAVP